MADIGKPKHDFMEPPDTSLDDFGLSDPRRMPSYFFGGSAELDYKTAVLARVDSQCPSVIPRYWYVTAHLQCPKCRGEFIWTAQEQLSWFEQFGFPVDAHPKFCKACKWNTRHLIALRNEYDATVASARLPNNHTLKARIIDIVNELMDSLGALPAGMIQTKDLFERQLANLADHEILELI